jgi:hypothetical protein
VEDGEFGWLSREFFFVQQDQKGVCVHAERAQRPVGFVEVLERGMGEM